MAENGRLIEFESGVLGVPCESYYVEFTVEMQIEKQRQGDYIA